METANLRLKEFCQLLKENNVYVPPPRWVGDMNMNIGSRYLQTIYNLISKEVNSLAAIEFVKTVAMFTKPGGSSITVAEIERLINNGWVWRQKEEHEPETVNPVTLFGDGENVANFLKRHLSRKDYILWYGRNRFFIFSSDDEYSDD